MTLRVFAASAAWCIACVQANCRLSCSRSGPRLRDLVRSWVAAAVAVATIVCSGTYSAPATTIGTVCMQCRRHHHRYRDSVPLQTVRLWLWLWLLCVVVNNKGGP
jgi:hypothetical protein